MRRLLALVGIVLFGTLVAAPSALAHGDGPSHYLEMTSLYPSFAPEPAQSVELQLMGYVDAAKRAGYPIRVGIANEGDLTDRPQMLKTPQAYAERVVRVIGGPGALEAPVIIVTAYGIGVAGTEERDGAQRTIDRASAKELVRGIDLPPRPRSNALAETAMRAVRQVAERGGHPLPAKVAPATFTVPPGARSSEGGNGGWLPLGVFVLVFSSAALLFEIRKRRASIVLNKRRERR